MKKLISIWITITAILIAIGFIVGFGNIFLTTFPMWIKFKENVAFETFVIIFSFVVTTSSLLALINIAYHMVSKRTIALITFE